jgi:gliding motility-associated-like protein
MKAEIVSFLKYFSLFSKKMRGVVCFIHFLFLPFISLAQTETTDHGSFTNCTGGIKLFTYDFTAISGDVINTNIGVTNSLNICCNYSMNPSNSGCIYLDIVVEPGTLGVSFVLAGATGSTSIYYENCGETYAAGDQICFNSAYAVVDPVTENEIHRFMFCRSGATTYNLTITQISPSFPDDLAVSEGCTIPLEVTDLDPSSIVWNTISPDNIGDWNHLLSCVSGCLSTVLTPTSGSPSIITIEVCGSLHGSCSADTYCSESTVSIYPDLFADAGPDVAFCLGSDVAVTSTGTVIGGAPPYTYSWTGVSGDGIGFNYSVTSSSTTEEVDFFQTGVYELTITDVNDCATGTDQIEVFEFDTDIEAFITTDNISICYIPTPVVTIDGYVTETETGDWTSSNGGVFGTVSISSPGALAGSGPAVSTTWTPTEGSTGIVTLTLTPTNNAGCPITPASITVDLTEFTTVLTANPTHVSCNGGDDGSIDLIETPGTPAYATFSYDWDNDGVGDEDDLQNLGGLELGTYTVIVTDINGCSGTTDATITEPLELVVTITGDALLCNGDSDGTVSGTVSGGTAPYVVTLDETNATLNVTNDGDTYSFTGLTSGTYNVTVTDANGVTGGCLATNGPVEITEPLPLELSVFGDAIVCFEGGDGNVTGDISGGTAPYLLTLYNANTNTIIATQNVVTDGGSYDFSNLNGLSSGGSDSYYVVATDANGITGGCTVTSTIATVTEPLELVVTITGGALLCNGDSGGTVSGTITGGTAPYVIILDETNATLNVTNNGDTYSFTGLTSGMYNVTVTDANGTTGGCLVTNGPVEITEPLPLEITVFGDAIACFEGGDGNVTGAISGGTAPYILTLYNANTNTIITTQNVVTDGGTYDFSNLNGLPSGGSDSYYVVATDANGTTGGCTVTSTIATVTEPLELVVTITGDALLCNGDSGGTVSGTITGGTAPYVVTLDETSATLNVTNDGDTYSFTGLTSGTYNVTVTDANGVTGGCLATNGPVEITEPLPLELSVFGDAIACFEGGDGNVTGAISGGTAPYTLTLYNANTNTIITTQNVVTDGGTYDFSNLNGLPSGGSDSYYVVATDANGTTGGCTVTSTIATVTEPLELVVTITGDALLCNGDSDGTVSGTVSGGTAPYVVTLDETNAILNFTNNGDTYSFTGLASGMYNVTVTDANGTTGGCLATNGPVEIIEPLPLEITVFGDAIACFEGGDGNVTGDISGGTAPYTLTLYNANTNTIITTQNVVTDGGTYDFSNLNGLPSGGSDSYFVVATDANGTTGGCTVTSTIATVTEPLELVVIITGDALLCNGDSDGTVSGTISGGTAPYVVTLDETNATLNVTNNGDTYSFTGLASGIYNVTVTDANGTTGGCLATNGPVEIIEPLVLMTTSTMTTEYNSFGVSCGDVQTGIINNGGVQTIPSGGTPSYTYLWTTIDGEIQNGQEIEQSPTGLIAGTYNVLVTDENGCTFTDELQVTEPVEFTLDALTPSVYAGGFNVTGCDYNGTIDILVSGGVMPYAFDWIGPNDFSSTNANLVDLESGTFTVVVTDANDCQVSGSVTLTSSLSLTQTAVVSVYPSGDNISCYGASDGFINVTTSGEPDFTWNWSGPNGFTATSEDITNVIAGSYTLEITDANGCTLDTTIVLTEPTPLVQEINSPTYASGDNISCNGLDDGSIAYTVNGGSPNYVYAWDNGMTTPDIAGLTVGNYTVTVTDINGCTIDTTIVLTEPTPLVQEINSPTYASGDNISCNGLDDGSIAYTVNGGSPNYVYAWDNGMTTPDIAGLTAGNYTVTVTDINGCTIDTTIVLTEPTPLLQDINSPTYASGDNISCNGLDDGSIAYTVNGGSPNYVYAWDNGMTTPDIAGLTAGNYTVTVTDINGCTIDTTIVLTEPTPLVQEINSPTYASGDNISCNGLDDGSIAYTVNGGSPNYVYAWDNGMTTSDIAGLTAGNYTVTVTDINGCTLDTTIVLTEPTPLVQEINSPTYASGDNISCNGLDDGSIAYTVNGGSPNYVYAWDNGMTTPDIAGLTAGNYTVTVTDINGCTIDTTIVLIEPTPLVQEINSPTYASGDNISCNGLDDGSIAYTVNGGSPNYVYVWDNGMTTSDIAGLTAGNYTVTVTDINGCTIDTTIVLTEPTPLVQEINSPTYASGDNISCNGLDDGSIAYTVNGGSPNYVYAWDNGMTTPDIAGLTAGNYTVTVTDINGCSLDTTIMLSEPTILEIYLDPSVYEGGYNVSSCYPNGEIDLTITGGSSSYSIIWNNGATIENLTDLSEGTYSVTVIDLNGCLITDEITLTSAGGFSTSISAPTYNGAWNISCNGQSDGRINLVINGGISPFVFEWSNGATSQNVTNVPAGEYSVTITDGNGCVRLETIVLTEPEPLISSAFVISDYNGSDISCFGANDASISSTVVGGTLQYIYQWILDGSVVSSTTAYNGIGPGNYTLQITDANGCSTVSNVVVQEPPLLTASLNILSDYFGLPVSCVGNYDGQIEAIGVGGWGDLTYVWSSNPAITNSLLDGAGVGNHIVTVTDENGCFDYASVVLDGHAIPSFSMLPPIDLCEGETASFEITTSRNDDTCLWKFSSGEEINSTNPFDIAFGIIGCIDVTVTVTSLEGCVSEQFHEDYVCYLPNPVAAFTQSAEHITTIPSNVKFTNHSTVDYFYEWNFGDGYFSNEEHPMHFFPDDVAGTYDIQLIVTSFFGCTDTAYSKVYVKEELLLFVPNTFTPNNDMINDIFTPRLSQGYDRMDYELLIFNRWGEVLFQSHNHRVGWDGTYGGQLMQDDTYVWRIKVGSEEDGSKREFVGHVNLIR